MNIDMNLAAGVSSAEGLEALRNDIAEVQDKTFYTPALYIWVFTHKSKLRLKEGGIRTDRLAVEIDKELWERVKYFEENDKLVEAQRTAGQKTPEAVPAAARPAS